jgi:hypothetical protein
MQKRKSLTGERMDSSDPLMILPKWYRKVLERIARIYFLQLSNFKEIILSSQEVI